MRVATGTYLGDGVDGRNINIPNWGTSTPDLVLTWGNPSTNFGGSLRFSSMAGDLSTDMDASGLYANGIQALQARGFQVGDGVGVNTTGRRYCYIAIGGSPTTDFSVSSYEGDGIDLRAVTGAGFAPDMAIIIPANGNQLTWSTTSHAAGQSNSFLGTSGTEHIKSFGVDGVVVGLGADVNELGSTYYIAFLKKTAGRFNILPYSGNSTSDTLISGAGFKPDVAMTECATAVSSGNVTRFFHHASGKSQLVGQSAQMTNGIKSLESDGFKVGSDLKVNLSGRDYIAPVFKASVPIVDINGNPVDQGAQSMRPWRHLRQAP